MAEVFSWGLGRRVRWEAVAACYPERPGAAGLFSVDLEAINRLGGCRRRWPLLLPGEWVSHPAPFKH